MGTAELYSGIEPQAAGGYNGADATGTAVLTAGAAIVVLIRLIVPVAIFRWPLAGGLAAMLVDAIDVILIEAIGLGGFSHYAALDKALDMYYLTFELLVSQRWQPLARWTSTALYVWRAAGFVVFEATQTRAFLLVFPNVFENFYIAFLALRKVAPEWQLTPRRLAAVLFVVTVPKIGQEYLLHYAEAQPWDWIKRNIIRDAWRF